MNLEKGHQFQTNHAKEKKDTGITRRNFIKGAGAFILGSPLLEHYEVKKNIGQNTIEHQSLLNCEEQIKRHLEQRTILSKQEIIRELERCQFLKGSEIKIQHMEIKNPGSPLSDRDIFKDSLDEALGSDQIELDSGTLNVVQTDFEKCAISYAKAFYLHEYRAIFIDQEKDDIEKQKDMEEEIYRAAIGQEYEWRSEQLMELSRSRSNPDDTMAYLHTEEGSRKQKELWQWFDSWSTVKKLEKIMPWIAKHEKKVIESARDFRTREAMDYVVAKTSLPHEAFHYFFENQLGRDGYAGPDMAEILAVAIKGKRQRFGTINPNYGISCDIEGYLKQTDVTDEASLKQFCNKITLKYNLASSAQEYSIEEWRALDAEEQYKNMEWKNFSNFLNEYLARVYNGILGNTPKHVKHSLEKIISQIGGNLPKYKFEETYHEPTLDDIGLFQKMKWQGKSLFL